jgi:predicted nucleic acid-binding protein
MTRCVLDASVALAWIFDDEFSTYADAIAALTLQNLAMVPIIWPPEMANAVLGAVRRGRIPESRATAMIHALHRLPIDVD